MVIRSKHSNKKTPGHIASLLLLLGACMGTQPVHAQASGSTPPISSQPVPSGLELAKIIWSTMAAIDHGNQSGNYSVLRDISAPGFQILNNATQLAETFKSIRDNRVDLSNTLLLGPVYSAPPQIVEANVMRVQGYFGLRPTAISFDFYYQWVQGKWRLYGVALGEQSIATRQPE